VARPPHVPQPETELEEFFDLSIDPLSIIGVDGTFKRVNASFVRLLGYPQPELLARSALEILHPDDVEPAREALAQLAEGHDLVGFEARVICADGSVRWLEWNTRAMPERGVVYSVGRDTTERRRVDSELREAQRSVEAGRDELRVLAGEQAALRRVATLVAQDVPPRELFGAVAREVGTLFGADFSGMIRFEDDKSVATAATWAAVGEHPPVPARWDTVPGDPPTMIVATRKAARVDDWTSIPGAMAAFIRDELGVSSSVGCPIVVEGRLWGAVAVHSKQSRPLPPDTESRIAQFTDLVGTAIANAESRRRADRLAEEQAALRRAATLVAKEASPAEVFATVAEEAANGLGGVECALLRDEGGGTASTVAAWGAGMSARFPVGTRLPVDGDGVLAFVLREARPHRIDDYSAVGESTAESAREHGIGSAVGYPIVVGGGIWGAIIAATFGAEPCPPETESRIARFADLVATAIANAETRAEMERLGAEQAALRRVATLVAQGTPSDALFRAVCEEVVAVVGAHASAVVRFEADGTVTTMGAHAALQRHLRQHVELDPNYVVGAVHRTGRAARFDTDDPAAPGMPEVVRAERIRSGLASPIVVEGELWGAITIASRGRPLPAGTDRRLADFTALVATAIANTDARQQVTALADEQAALRRVATLVARERPEGEVLAVVAEEVTRLFGGEATQINRYEPDGTATSVAAVGTATPIGTRITLEDDGTTTRVYHTGRPARIDAYSDVGGWFADQAQRSGIESVVGVPIVVDGHLWGVLVSGSREPGSLPSDCESRLTEFAELLATAISNLHAREELAASRARIAAAADDERRRVVRDLHDGAQQRLVHTVITLKLAQQALAKGTENGPLLLQEAIGHAEQATVEVRELAHGILPSVLTHGGLRAGIDALGARTPIPVEIDVPVDRLPAPVEATAYFVVAEALTNVAKHSSAQHAEVVARIDDGTLRVEVRDDGVGGASPDGTGLVGLADRLAVLDGRLEVDSPPGGGTRLTAAIPLARSGHSVSA
jgi:PAS domain S-box-containing protein